MEQQEKTEQALSAKKIKEMKIILTTLIRGSGKISVRILLNTETE